MFGKNKRAEEEKRKLRFIEGALRSLLRDTKDLERMRKTKNEVIEDRAKEILEWVC